MDAKYHIRYYSTVSKFDIVCSYHEGAYTWFLSSEPLGISGIILGTNPQMTDKDVGTAAITYIRKILKGKMEDLDMAEGCYREQVNQKSIR